MGSKTNPTIGHDTSNKLPIYSSRQLPKSKKSSQRIAGKIIHKPQDCGRRFTEAVLGVATLLALFWSTMLYDSKIDQTNAHVVPHSHFWWALGIAALAVAFFSSLSAMVVLKIHKHPLPIILILIAILSLTLLLVSGWQPITIKLS